MSSLLINGTAPTALQLAAIRADLGLGAGNPGSANGVALLDNNADLPNIQLPPGMSPLGPYSTVALLEAAYPAVSNPGKTAYIGVAAPYAEYVSNGVTGVSGWKALAVYTLGADGVTPSGIQGVNVPVLTVNNTTGGIDASGVISGVATIAQALTVRVSPFVVDSFKFIGGSYTVLPNGTWYVGVDLLTRKLIALPRLGHRGWVPVARVETNATTITVINSIDPKLPACRIPRTMKKILNKQSINVVVMGSSLTQGGNTTDWPGMLLGSGSDIYKYKIPTTVNPQYTGVGGSPNQYQLAMLGFASSHSAAGFPNSGISGAITGKTPPNGRSNLFKDTDLVILGCLANGGDYRLECIEPIVRKLRAAGVEVIITTDDPQNPGNTYAILDACPLYVDGPEVMRIADLYGVEVADTAAHVFEAHLRYGTGIYADTIHMSNGNPAGRNLPPSCGHELWARAIRSVIPCDATVTGTPATSTFDFSTGTQGFLAYGASTISASSGALVVTKTTTDTNQWGTWITSLPSAVAGDTVRVRGTVLNVANTGLYIGMQSGGWASNNQQITTDGPFDVLLTLNNTSTSLLFFNYLVTNISAGTMCTIDNLIVDITHTTTTITENTPGRKSESIGLPPIRRVIDYKTPADTFIITPASELFQAMNNTNMGTLIASPWGAGSFARRFYTDTYTSTKDLLSLGVGKQAVMGAQGVVGWSLVHYRDVADGACTFDISRNGAFVKTMTIGAVPFANEWYTTLFTPTELNILTPTERGDSIMITVTAGTLKVAAFVALTADIDYVFPEQITFVGSWLAKEASRSGLVGRPTDTVGDYAFVKCSGNRLQWIISGNPGSKMWNAYSDREVVTNQNLGGNYHIYNTDGLIGPNTTHYIKCVEANAAGTQANGHSLHVGGAIIVNDR